MTNFTKPATSLPLPIDATEESNVAERIAVGTTLQGFFDTIYSHTRNLDRWRRGLISLHSDGSFCTAFAVVNSFLSREFGRG